MIINVLMMNPADNVVTTVTEINKGEDVCYMNGTKCVTLKAEAFGFSDIAVDHVCRFV